MVGQVEVVRNGPVPDLGAVYGEAEAPPDLAGGKRIRIPFRVAIRLQCPAQERLHLVRPRRHVVAAGRTRLPVVAAPLSPCREVGRAQRIQLRLPDLKRLHRLLAGDRTGYKLHHRVADMRDTQSV